MPQKILYVITKSAWGGAQKYVFDLATRLPRDTHDVAVALGGDGPLAGRLTAADIRVINVPALERDISFGKDWAAFRALLKIFRAESPNAVHLNSSKIGLFGAIAARLAGIRKIVFTAHGWIFNEDRSLPVKIFYGLLSWLTGLCATDIIVLSEYEYRQTKKLPFVIGKTHLVRNGISQFETLTRADSRKFLSRKIDRPENYLDDKLVIGTISELHPNKGLEYAIKAISSLVISHRSSDIVFVIIGGGEEELKLRALIRELNLENQVFLTGFIGDAERLLPAFDIFTLTSLKEGLPYVVLEAGLMGLSIVASSVGAIPEIFIDGCGLPVAPKDTAGISAAIQKLISDVRLRNEMGTRLKQKIASDFTYAAMLEATKRLYHK